MKKHISSKALECLVGNYFDYCDAVNEERGEIVKPYTLSGLISYIGITRAQFSSMLRDKKNEHILQAAKAKIEAFIEENALTGELSVNASANSLKYNFGWGEKQENAEEKTGSDITIALSNDISELGK